MLNKTVIPFGQVPQGAFFWVHGHEGRLLQKTGREQPVATDDDWNVILLKDDAPCVIKSVMGGPVESDDSDDSEWQDKFIENDYDEDYEDWGREP